MKKLSVILGACLFSTSLFGADANSEIENLKKQVSSLQKSIDELEQRADENEFTSALDKINFGLEFSTSVTNTNYNLAGHKYHANNKWMSELFLNMNAQINDKTKFYGRLSIAKNWSQMGWGLSGSHPLELDAGRNTRTSGPVVYLSRAYLDYAITPELIATIGRQPGTDGPGSNLRNNALRQSTYPALMLNVLGDALVLTYKPDVLSDYDFAARLAYGKVYQWDNEGKVKDWMGDQEDVDANLYYAEVEGKIPALGDNLMIFNVAHLTDFSLPLPVLGVKNLGDLSLYNLHFEQNKAFGSDFNYFISLGYSKGSNSNHKNIDVTPIIKAQAAAQAAASMSSSGKAAAATTQPNTAAAIAKVQEMFKINEKNGYSVHVGARYDFTQSFKFGYEFFWGSKYWYTMSRPSINDPLNMRMTRGMAHDIYGIYQLDRNQFLRLSYTHVDNKFSNSATPIGGSVKLKDKNKADSFMLMYNVKL